MTFMVGLFAYAIMAYQLLDIEVVVRRATVFAGLFAFVYAVFSGFTIVGQQFFHNVLGWNQWTAMIPTVLVITFALRPLEVFLTNATDKYLFQKDYDYKDLLKVFTTEVLSILDINELPKKTMEGLNNIVKLESFGFVMLNPDTGKYELKTSQGIKDKNVVLTADDPLVYYMNMSQDHIQKAADIQRASGHGDLKEDFKKLNAELCLPIIFNSKLVAFMSLGMKKSGDPYNAADIEVLMALARTEAIALQNAKLFDELSKTQAEAAQREKMAVVGTLAAGINHEICNPLGIARGHCEMFLLNCRDGIYNSKAPEEVVKQAMEIMQKVIKETDRATAITKRLSSFAKPSKNYLRDEIKLADEVQEVLAILGHDLKLNNIEMIINVPADLPKFFADRKQLQEILFNIIRNAAQAITGAGKISVSGHMNSERMEIEIEDTGSGIPQDKIDQIFHPFYTTKAPGQGTGLGLFIVKQIIERNKGTIAVTSQVGKGTKFLLTFEPVPEAAHA